MKKQSLLLFVLFVLLGTVLTNYKGTEVKQSTVFPTATPILVLPSPSPLPTIPASGAAVLGEKNQDTVLVTNVIDGDTIEIEGGKIVRYIGIDTPETKHPKKKVQCFGIEAFMENKALVEGKQVRLEKDISETDRYGRLLRYVYIGDLFINDYLVRQGYAYAATFPPDVKYQSVFKQAQTEAEQNNRGL